MAAASDSRVAEGFVVGFLPIACVPFATCTLGFVEIYGGSTRGTGASSGKASSGGASSGICSSYPLTSAAPTIPYPIVPDHFDGFPEVPWSPSSCATTIGVDLEADEVEAAAATAVAASEMSEESEEEAAAAVAASEMSEESEEEAAAAVATSEMSEESEEWISEQLFGEAEESEEEAAEDLAHTNIHPMDRSWSEDSSSFSRNDGRLVSPCVCCNDPTVSQGEGWEAVHY
jgi:hypothetical protein